MNEPKLCPNCPFVAIFRDEVEKQSYTNQPAEDTNLKLCSRLRALARQHGILHLCKPFNYGLDCEPQKPPEPKKIRKAKQTTLTSE